MELDWWEEHAIGEIELVATPARHASGRHLLDQNCTLCGQATHLWDGLDGAFFSGDTGLFPALTEIGERLGPFDVTMIEVGAYGQAWPDWHLGPEQALRAHGMLRGGVLLPVHWGLVNLAFHAWTEPIERVLVAADKADVTVGDPTPRRQLRARPKPPPVQRWWPNVPWRTEAEYPIVANRNGLVDEPRWVRHS